MRFILSVDANGVVSLWDTYRERLDGKQPEEAFCNLDLTPEQESLINTAQRIAQENTRELSEHLPPRQASQGSRLPQTSQRVAPYHS